MRKVIDKGQCWPSENMPFVNGVDIFREKSDEKDVRSVTENVCWRKMSQPDSFSFLASFSKHSMYVLVSFDANDITVDRRDLSEVIISCLRSQIHLFLQAVILRDISLKSLLNDKQKLTDSQMVFDYQFRFSVLSFIEDFG